MKYIPKFSEKMLHSGRPHQIMIESVFYFFILMEESGQKITYWYSEVGLISQPDNVIFITN